LIARGVSDVEAQLENLVRQTPVPIDDQTYMGRSVLTGEIVNLADVDASELNTRFLTFQKAFGYKSLLVVPLMREGRGVGVFALVSNRIGAFSQRQIDLVQTFADQAVIAIENVRLFDEVQAKTRDLTEALQQQTATGEVLKVIASSPTNVEPALEAIVKSACAFCDAYDAGLLLKIGDDLHFSAHHGPIRPGQQLRPLNRQWVTGRSVVDRCQCRCPTFRLPRRPSFLRGNGTRANRGYAAPSACLSCGRGSYRRDRAPSPGTSSLQRQTGCLLQTFADQAVIAIGNVRLFDEVQAKTRDLSESLQQQTATPTCSR